jgi:cytochrome P450
MHFFPFFISLYLSRLRLSRVYNQQKRRDRAVAVDEVAISDRYIRDVLLNFILAGRDTTAQTLLWSFYLLSMPENQGPSLVHAWSC